MLLVLFPLREWVSISWAHSLSRPPGISICWSWSTMPHGTRRLFLCRTCRPKPLPESWPSSLLEGGIPKQLVLQAVWCLLGVSPLRISVYHPQTNGLVEQFNGTLKWMLHKFIGENGRNWPPWIPYRLLTIREVPQASTGFYFLSL